MPIATKDSPLVPIYTDEEKKAWAEKSKQKKKTFNKKKRNRQQDNGFGYNPFKGLRID